MLCRMYSYCYIQPQQFQNKLYPIAVDCSSFCRLSFSGLQPQLNVTVWKMEQMCRHTSGRHDLGAKAWLTDTVLVARQSKFLQKYDRRFVQYNTDYYHRCLLVAMLCPDAMFSWYYCTMVLVFHMFSESLFVPVPPAAP